MKTLINLDTGLIRSVRPLMAVIVLGVMMVSPIMAADSAEVVLGAEVVGGPVTPVTAHIDIFSIEPPPQWRLGDPIKEIPRRFTGGSKAPVDPGIGLPDPLVDVQRSAPLNNDRVFTTPITNFDGQGYSGVSPPDTVGDIGPTYYIQSINGGGGALVQIYDKTGTAVGSVFSMDTLGSGSCASGLGDPIVLYDRLAERWMMQEFSNSGNYLCFYISDTPDPTEGTWHHYAFQAPSFPDYPHIGVWPDAYYTTANEDLGGSVYAFDRENMIVGGTARALQRFTVSQMSGYSGFQTPTPADLDGADAPPAGAPGYIMRHYDDEAHDGSPDPAWDTLEIYAFSVDWDSPGSSTLTQLPDIDITDYNSWMVDYTTFYSVPQPNGGGLDPIREVILNRLVYRNFGDHETLAGVFPTNINEATSGSTVNAGQRWFELRKIGAGDWVLHQEGTYQPGDSSENRFVGSLAMDQSGNMALAYSFTDLDPAADPGLNFTGRLADDPLDAMSQPETILVAGNGGGESRWGDYASMNVDPADDCTFWFTGEYMSGNWSSRIGSFKFEACGCELVLDSPTVSAAVQGANVIRVQWDDSGLSEISEYRVYRSATVSGGPYDLVATVPDSSPGAGGGAGYSWDDTTVSGGITYHYMVRSSDGSACLSDPSNVASAEATGVCLLAPDFAGVIDVSNPGEELCALDLTWSAGTSHCGGSLGYSVYRSTTSGFTPDLANQVADGVLGLSFRDSDNLVYGERYYYIVRATDTSNNVSEANVVEAAAKPTGVIAVSDWSDDVEAYATIADAVVDGWSHGADSGSDDWSVATGDDHTTGTGNAFQSFNVGEVTDKWLQTDAIGVIASTELSFWHKYQFESGYDGGVLEISVDAGASWQDLEGQITSGGYNDTISTSWSSPIGGQNAWSGDQLAFGQVVVDLSVFDGQTVMIRWRMGCDSSVDDGPWLIDDVLVTDAGVAGPCSSAEPPLFADGFESGGMTFWSRTIP